MPRTPSIETLTFGRYACPHAIGHSRPTISWRFQQANETVHGFVQTGYELHLLRGDTENTYHVTSPQSLDVPWPLLEAPLHSRERLLVRVRAMNTDGLWTEWAEQSLETSLLHRKDWHAQVISSSESQPTTVPKRPVYVYKAFDIDLDARQALTDDGARIYATALGVYHLQLNGRPIAEDILAPGWQSYDHRLHFQTHIVPADLFVLGENTLSAVVGEGWYSGQVTGADDIRNVWGEDPGVMIQLEGPTFSICTGADWHWFYGPLITSEWYNGETFDAAIPYRFDKDGNRKCKIIPLPSEADLIAPESPPIRRIGQISVKKILTSASGRQILDFGQNLVGWVKIKNVPARSGDRFRRRISLRFAEVMENAEICVRTLQSARQTDTIYPGAEVITDYEPLFTTHGFRFVEVRGMPVDIDNFSAIVVHSDIKRLGTFECSNTMINQLHQNVVWSQKGNMAGLPTDCPQRAERLGWTGDVQVFAPTACFLFDMSGFLSNWLHDLLAEQLQDPENQLVPPILVPNKFSSREFARPFPQAVWCDVIITLPWRLYMAYGSRRILEEAYEGMCAWLDHGIPRGAAGLWLNPPNGFQFGDWLDPRAPPNEPAAAMTDPYLVADAYLVWTTGLLSTIAKILDKPSDAERRASQHQALRRAFRNEYCTAKGRMVSDSQTSYVLALEFNLLDEDQIGHAVNRLVQLVQKNNYRIGTGFAGTGMILNALASNDRVDVAYRMLEESQCPSWLYPISMGATTIWERWDSMLADGSVNPGEMTSFNHFALGSVADFLHSVVGGISPVLPGYKQSLIHPRPGGTVRSAHTSLLTPFGRLSCQWELVERQISIQVSIPPSTTGIVVVGGWRTEIGSGLHEWELPLE